MNSEAQMVAGVTDHYARICATYWQIARLHPSITFHTRLSYTGSQRSGACSGRYGARQGITHGEPRQ